MWSKAAEGKVKASVSDCRHRKLLTMLPACFPKTIVDQSFLVWRLPTFPPSRPRPSIQDPQHFRKHYHAKNIAIDFFLFFSSRGNVIFLVVIVLFSCPFTLQKHSPLNFSNWGEIKQTRKNKQTIKKKNKDKYRRIHQAWAKHCFSSTGEQSSSPPLLFGPPETSQELTINTSLWTASRKNTHNALFFFL